MTHATCDAGLFDMFDQLARSMDRRDRERRDEAAAVARRRAKDQLGAEVARELGLESDAAHYFGLGFYGWPIKKANPRKAGFEAEFRAGKREALLREDAIARLAATLYIPPAGSRISYGRDVDFDS